MASMKKIENERFELELLKVARAQRVVLAPVRHTATTAKFFSYVSTALINTKFE